MLVSVPVSRYLRRHRHQGVVLRTKLRTIIVPVTLTFFNFSLKLAPCQKSKGLIEFHLRTQVSLHDLVEDLLTELVEEYTTVLRISGSFTSRCLEGQLYVSVYEQFYFAVTTVPEFTIQFTDRVVLTDGGQGISMYQPPGP